MRVLVTGHRGYLGSVLTCVLRNANFEVVGIDSDLYSGCDFGRVDETVPSYDFDVRDIEFADLLSFDAVVHLAALSDDAQGELDPELTDEINLETTIRLAALCRRAQVSRFLFASSCSVYGAGSCELLHEDSPTNPLSRYAMSKLCAERELANIACDGFTPVFLRNATAYGVSPRLRTDIVVNDFVGAAVTSQRIVMRSAGQAWRPLIHVEDIARAYAAILTAPDELVRNQAFNVARCGENYRVIDVADEVRGMVPFTTRQAATDTFDQRSYRVDASKLRHAFPKLKMRWTLQLGIRQLHTAMENAGMTHGEWRSDRYRRIHRLRTMLEKGEVDKTLRRRELTLA